MLRRDRGQAALATARAAWRWVTEIAHASQDRWDWRGYRCSFTGIPTLDVLGLITLLALGGLVYLTLLVGAIAWGLTHPPRRTYAAALGRGIAGLPDELAPPLKFESWSFRSRGLDLPAWDVRGGRSASPTVIFVHGWGDSRIGALVRMAPLAPLASRLIAWDLPGHGEAPGVSRLGKFEAGDLRALIDHVGGEVVLFGWSLGAGLCIEVAADEERVKAVIAEAPYRFQDQAARNVLRNASLPSGLSLHLALAALGLKGSWKRDSDRAGLAAGVSCPLLVLHGTEDEVCPVDDARAIAAAAPRARLIEITGGDHNRLWTEPEWARLCEAAVREFLGA